MHFVQTLPHSSPLEAAAIKSSITSPTSSGIDVFLPSPLELKDEDIFPGLSDTTSLSANSMVKRSKSSSGNVEVDESFVNPIVKSEGVPTQYEKIDSVDARGDVEVAVPVIESQSISTTDPLCRCNQDANNLGSNSTTSEVNSRTRRCGLEPVPEARHCSTSQNLPESPKSLNVIVPNAAASEGQQLTQKGGSGSKDANLSGHVTDSFSHVTGKSHLFISGVSRSHSMGKSALPEIKVREVSPSTSNQPSTGDRGGVEQTDSGNWMVRMKALGHRRSSSAPTKRPYCRTPCVGMAESATISQLRKNSEDVPLTAPKTPHVRLMLRIVFIQHYGSVI